MLAFIATEGGGGGRGHKGDEREKDLDVILGCVCKTISSSNQRIKSF